MSSLSELLRVGPEVRLADIDPTSTPGLPDRKPVRRDPKAWARAELAEVGTALAVEQEKLFASAKKDKSFPHRVLLVLQAMDCGGKDGTIKKVVGMVNPQGVHIVGFGPPTAEELEHDFLWRIRKAVPVAGLIGVFNRSHYEDVLVVRVNKLAPKREWLTRYQKINDFESELADSGVKLVKVMLHISYGEQRQRLLDRLADPTKFWKYNPADVDNRALWPAYQDAYHDALARCSTDLAPWYVVPADRKWYRDWAVAHLLLEAMSSLNLRYPAPDFDPPGERARLYEGNDS